VAGGCDEDKRDGADVQEGQRCGRGREAEVSEGSAGVQDQRCFEPPGDHVGEQVVPAHARAHLDADIGAAPGEPV
jgi:hypothetical protein